MFNINEKHDEGAMFEQQFDNHLESPIFFSKRRSKGIDQANSNQTSGLGKFLASARFLVALVHAVQWNCSIVSMFHCSIVACVS